MFKDISDNFATPDKIKNKKKFSFFYKRDVFSVAPFMFGNVHYDR
jgi:hypothetical protein